MPTTAVLLLQMGGPDSLEAVRPFLKNLFRDREIIRLGPAVLQPLIAALIVARRTPAVIEKYREIGGASPLRRITEQQAAALEQQLTIPCAVGMRYWHPFTADTLQSLQARGISRLVVLPLYPQYSRATSGSSINDLKRLVAKQAAPMKLTILEQFHDHPGYISAIADRIRQACSKLEQPEQATILFSAHSLPQSFIDNGDPYLEQVMKTVEMVMAQIPSIPHHIGFQSKAGPVAWLEPSTEHQLKTLGEAGCTNLVVVPISFVSDHIETLHEIDIEYRELAHLSGIRSFVRTESLNDHPDFIACLADLVQSVL